MSRIRSLRSFWKRPTNRFLISLGAFLFCSWLSYHLLSVLVGPPPQETHATGTARSVRPEIVARVPSQPPSVPSGRTFPMLAAQTQQVTDGTAVTPSATGLIDIERQATALISEAEQLVKSEKVIEARTLLNQFLAKYGDSDACRGVYRMALELGQKTILSPKVYPNDPLCSYYTVKPGDRLIRIARPCKVPYHFLAEINGIEPHRLRAGQKIKLVCGPVNAVVYKHQFRMYLYLQDTLFASYRLGLGKNNGTPEGIWLVQDRVKNPPYTDVETGKVYSGTDPKNPTGGFWVALKGISRQSEGKTGYGIHGTIDEDSIGKMKSHGCIRLAKKDIVEVYGMVSEQVSQVTIKP